MLNLYVSPAQIIAFTAYVWLQNPIQIVAKFTTVIMKAVCYVLDLHAATNSR